MRLPTSLQRLVDGLKGTSGPRSALSLLTTGGVKPDQVPIVVYRSRATGQSGWSTHLATICALKEDVTGERILMLSWDQDAVSPFEPSETPGDSGEIRFDLLIPIEGLSGIVPSTSRKPRTSGISGVPCDVCRKPFEKGDWYRSEVRPPHGLAIVCLRCAEKSATIRV